MLKDSAYRGLLRKFGARKAKRSSSKLSDEFKRDAVAQIAERGYPVREVLGWQGGGGSPYSLYAWKEKIA